MDAIVETRLRSEPGAENQKCNTIPANLASPRVQYLSFFDGRDEE